MRKANRGKTRENEPRTAAGDYWEMKELVRERPCWFIGRVFFAAVHGLVKAGGAL
jgi:hypothetical protein